MSSHLSTGHANTEVKMSVPFGAFIVVATVLCNEALLSDDVFALSAGHANREVKMYVRFDAFKDSEFPVMPELNTNPSKRKKGNS